MERRGEGFERERYVPPSEPTRESTPRYREPVTPEPVAREPVRHDIERQTSHTPALRPSDYEAPGVRPMRGDLTRWGPIFAGFFVALSTLVLLGVLGAALGFTAASQTTTPGGAATPGTDAGTMAMVWGAFALIVSFFVGGWIAGRLAAVGGPMLGTVHGFAVWAFTISSVLILGALGAAGIVGAVAGDTTTGAGFTLPGLDFMQASTAAWGTFIAMFLGLCAAMLGGFIGGKEHEYQRDVLR
jgi:hypothetical protein